MRINQKEQARDPVPLDEITINSYFMFGDEIYVKMSIYTSLDKRTYVDVHNLSADVGSTLMPHTLVFPVSLSSRDANLSSKFGDIGVGQTFNLPGHEDTLYKVSSTHAFILGQNGVQLKEIDNQADVVKTDVNVTWTLAMCGD